MADNWMLGETAALDDYIPNAPTNMLGDAAQGVKDWWTNQPSWLDRAQAENQRTAEAYQRGGMGEIARQLATDTTEAQDLASGFGGNIKGVKPPVVPGALAAVSEYRPPFYSAVEQAVQGAKQNAAPGQQWAGFLRNQPGVKPEEVEALGLSKLFEQPSVSKEAMLGEIAANRVNVGEVIKGTPHSYPHQTADEWAAAINSAERRGDWTEAHRLTQAQEGINPATGSTAGSTNFSQYTLPGGENYREMLLTLPEATPKIEIERRGLLETANAYPPHPEREAATARLQELNQQYPVSKTTGRTEGFRSSHYDEPNILAHVRYNDRVIDGKKTLFVEEVQSDWHQKGKREGYKNPAAETKFANLNREYDSLTEHIGRLEEGTGEQQRLVARRLDIIDEMNKIHDAKRSGVPDAPFKTTWPELAMKRIIREAAEKGYDKVAWTPGSVQAARYPEQLRQHVDNISWSMPSEGGPHPDGLRYVHAKPRAGGMDLVFTVNKDGVITEASAAQARGQHVEDIFGKDMSRQIMEKADGEIASKDFVIGAKGQQGFYDEILPATVNRLVKKHGGRVTQADMTAATAASPERVHSLDITPSLRAQAMKGFPLFTVGGIVAGGAMGDLAKQDEYQ